MVNRRRATLLSTGYPAFGRKVVRQRDLDALCRLYLTVNRINVALLNYLVRLLTGIKLRRVVAVGGDRMLALDDLGTRVTYRTESRVIQYDGRARNRITHVDLGGPPHALRAVVTPVVVGGRRFGVIWDLHCGQDRANLSVKAYVMSKGSSKRAEREYCLS